MGTSLGPAIVPVIVPVYAAMAVFDGISGDRATPVPTATLEPKAAICCGGCTFTCGRESVDVHAGQVTTYSPRLGVQAPRAADIYALTAWQRGELIFKDRPLGEVVARLERYRRGKIIVVGDAVRQLPVTGVFDIHDPDGALASLSLALPIRLQAIPGFVIVYSDSNR